MLSKNATWSLFGGALPALAALICTPYLLSALNIELFAITSLIISVTIFFYVYDLGMSKTMTYFISKSNQESHGSKLNLIGTAIVVTLLIGILITTAIYLLIPLFVKHWIILNKDILADAILAFQIATLSIVPGLISNVLKGVLEGQAKFKEANICKIFSGASIFLAPVAVIFFINKSLVEMSAAIVMTRYISLLLYFFYTVPMRAVLSLSVSRERFNAIYNYAGWAAISGFISTTFVYGDRFVVAGYLNPEELSIYIASQDILIRYLLIPWSMAIVLMPIFSANKMSKQEVVKLYFSQQKRVGIISFVLLVLAFFLSDFIIKFAGLSLPLESIRYVVAIQCIGIFFCALSQLPLIFLFSRGVPRLITIIFLIELVIYIFFAPVVFDSFGLLGACLIWAGRLILECLLLSYYSKKLMILL